MNVQKKQLTRSLSLTHIPCDRFKTSFLSLKLICPLTAETASYNTLLLAVLLRGCKKYPDISAISRRCEELYAAGIGQAVTSSGEYHCPGFNVDYIDNEYAIDDTDISRGVLELLDEILFHPLTENGVFVSEYVESEKRLLCEKILAQKNEKGKYSLLRCKQLMCDKERYGIDPLGDPAIIACIDSSSLWAYYRKLIGSAAANVTYAGKEAFETVEKRIADAFGAFDHEPETVPPTQVVYEVGEIRHFIEKEPVEQGKLAIGFRTGTTFSDTDYPALALCNEILGGSPVSKLFVNVREKLSLCYTCFSFVEMIKGVGMIASGIEVNNRDKAIDAILAQIEDIRNGKFNDDEFDGAKKSLVNAYRELTDLQAGLARWYFTRELVGNDDSPEEAAAKVNAVTKEEVACAAKKIKIDTIYFLEGTLASSGESR